jgi:hypothetical protein
MSSPPQRIDDEEQEVITLISDDPDFPPLAPRNRKTRFRHKAASVVETRNALIPGAPAPVQRNPTFGRPRALPIFASVLTAVADDSSLRQAIDVETKRKAGSSR